MKIIIIILLVLFYIYLFGWNSLQRYIEGSISINRNFIKKDIKSPGWKFWSKESFIISIVSFQEIYLFHDGDLNGGLKENISCTEYLDEDLKKCIDEASFKYTDLVLNIREHFP